MGVGYFMNKDKDKNPVYGGVAPPLSTGSQTNIYDVNNFKDSKAREQALVMKYNQLSKGSGSKIIDPNNLQGRGNLDNTGFTHKDTINSISGTTMSQDDFLVNDQGVKVEPFFKGSGPRNINFEENRSLMMHQGGPNAFRGKKRNRSDVSHGEELWKCVWEPI